MHAYVKPTLKFMALVAVVFSTSVASNAWKQNLPPACQSPNRCANPHCNMSCSQCCQIKYPNPNKPRHQQKKQQCMNFCMQAGKR